MKDKLAEYKKMLDTALEEKRKIDTISINTQVKIEQLRGAIFALEALIKEQESTDVDSTIK